MAGWFTSVSPFEEQVDKATASSLEDIALNLEISDLIRSKTVQPKEAMKVLKRRLENKNPNVQLATLKLTDTCVKNGGRHFLVEISSREFMDNLVSLLKTEGVSALNDSVKTKILDLIQTWAVASDSRLELSYVGETYRKLQWEGFQFPPKTEIASSMLDSSAPPEWIDSDVCMRCRTAFTFTNRKHHCRNCGNVFDAQCSSKTLPLPHLGIIQPVRVDDGCYAKLTSKSFSPPSLSNRTGFKPPQTSARMEPRGGRADTDFDEDLKRALQMSLDEIKGNSSGGYVSQAKAKSQATASKTNGKPVEEDEDPDLKAAIEASLRDMEEQKRKHTAALKNSASDNTHVTTGNILPKKDYELTAAEAEKINLLSTLVDRLQHQAPGTILREPQIQELYESIGTLRPKLARTYGETMSKYDTLLDLHAKLSTVVRYYDRMLEERLSNTYAQQTLGAYDSLQSTRPASGLYPSMSSNFADSRGRAENFYLGSGADRQPLPPQDYPTASPYTSLDHGYDRHTSPTAGQGAYGRPLSQYSRNHLSWHPPTNHTNSVPTSHPTRSASYSSQHAQTTYPGGSGMQTKQDTGYDPNQHPPPEGQYPQSPVTQRSSYYPPSGAPAPSVQPIPNNQSGVDPMSSPSGPLQLQVSAYPPPAAQGPYNPSQPVESPYTQYQWPQTAQNAYGAHPFNEAQTSHDTAFLGHPPQPTQSKPVEESLIEL